MIVALNMMDMASERRLTIDVEGLARRPGCPVVPMAAAKNQGVEQLREAILRPALAGRRKGLLITYHLLHYPGPKCRPGP